MTRTASSQAVQPPRHAVVIGSSMAGLLAARVLADHFTQVTICERDPAPEAMQVRKGVPQGAHTHALLRSGELIIEDLFPGIVAELLRGGTTKTDFAADVRWFHHGHWKLRYPSHLSMLCQSRPFLEGHLRRRLASCTNVTLRYATAVLQVLATADQARVTGVKIHPAAGGGSLAHLAADLVVDASGSGSRLPRWLVALHYPQPQASTVTIRLSYASRLYQPPAAARDWLAMILYSKAPESTRAGLYLSGRRAAVDRHYGRIYRRYATARRGRVPGVCARAVTARYVSGPAGRPTPLCYQDLSCARRNTAPL